MGSVFSRVEDLVSGLLPMTFLVFSGLYFTIKTKGMQFRKFFTAIKFALSPTKQENNGISSFGAVCNSLAATVGTGNIAGVAAAISIGGAGAVFWMWVSAFLSMVVKSAEIVIALFYRSENEYKGGPMYYINRGLGKAFKPLAVVFCVAGVFSAFSTGNITQINACVSVMSSSNWIKFIIGTVFSLSVAMIISGGAKKITAVTTAVLPLMSTFYIVFCLGVIAKNYKLLGDALLCIFKGAFSPHSVTGGVVGSVYTTVITGAQKGVFSNETGLGTAAMAHTEARDAKIETQGFYGIFEVFVDTLLICTLTALTILCSGVIIDYSTVESSGLVSRAFSTLYGGFSPKVLAIMLSFFAISSVIGWAAYGINCSEFLFGIKGRRLFVAIYPLFCIVGAMARVDYVFRLAEFFNGIMLIINVFVVLMLSSSAIMVLKGENDGKKNREAKERPTKRSGNAYF